jgi:predicted component of type VI protein secretion system
MNEQNPNLSKSELAAIDFMIAYMQENNKTQLEGFWDSITSGVQAAASAVAAGAAVVAAKAATAANAAASAVTDAVQAAVPAVVDAAEVAAPVVAEVAEVAAPVAVAAILMAEVNPNELSSVVTQLNGKGIGSQLTLENLIAIKNQYAKN